MTRALPAWVRSVMGATHEGETLKPLGVTSFPKPLPRSKTNLILFSTNECVYGQLSIKSASQSTGLISRFSLRLLPRTVTAWLLGGLIDKNRRTNLSALNRSFPPSIGCVWLDSCLFRCYGDIIALLACLEVPLTVSSRRLISFPPRMTDNEGIP